MLETLPLRATVELPDFVYGRIEQAAQERGLSVGELIKDVLEHGLRDEEVDSSILQRLVAFPIIHSKQPGTMDLSKFDFDDLLA